MNAREPDLLFFSSLTATADGRALVAVGCAEGVWIGFRHDSRCEVRLTVVSIHCSSFLAAMRRVLHLKMVTQCAMLEDFGIFLVLADKVSKLHLRLRILDSLIDPPVVSHYSRTILKHLSRHPHKARTRHKHLRSSTVQKTYTSSVLGVSEGGPLSYT